MSYFVIGKTNELVDKIIKSGFFFEIRLYAFIFKKFKREIITPQCYASPLVTDFSVVRQPSGLCTPHYFRIYGVSHTDGMSPIILILLCSKKLRLSTTEIKNWTDVYINDTIYQIYIIIHK